jgi:hypothetical protein
MPTPRNGKNRGKILLDGRIDAFLKYEVCFKVEKSNG